MINKPKEKEFIDDENTSFYESQHNIKSYKTESRQGHHIALYNNQRCNIYKLL
jgi:hypothetical protein